jgi:hypothetical protein
LALQQIEEGQYIFACLGGNAFECRELGVATSLTVELLGVFNVLYAVVNAYTNGPRDAPAIDM